MSHPEYAYRHLRPSSDEIRLLRIAPSSTPKHKLLITTKSGASYYLEVLDNLYQGLTEIRRRMDTESYDFSAKLQEELYVWADAICINQRDTDEVNQQVNMMDRIYSQASKVVVWLGADPRGEMPRVDKALTALSKMRRIITDERLTPGSAWRESTGIPDTDMADLLTIVGLPPLDSVEWSVILGLFNRTWFRRLWVVQEIALASKIEVWCGGATFSWRTIERVTELLKWDLEAKIIAADKTRADSSFYSLPSRSASILTSIRKWAISSRVPSSLFGTYKLISGRDKYHSSFAYAVLGALFPYEATDPRDKVFGALGLVRKLSADLATSPLGDADYSLTAGESEPLQDFMCQRATFEAGVDLLLDLVAPSQGKSQGIYPATGEPVIDAFWKTMMAGRRRFTRKQHGNNATDASVAREQFLRFWLYSHLLLALVEWGNKDMRVKLAALGYMERLVDPAHSEGPLNIPGHEELLATISKLQQPRDYHAWLDFAREQMVPFSLPAVGNRVMFSTKKPPPQPGNNISYLGLGHQEMREGDEVWISPRGPVPLLLRPFLDEAGGARRGYYSLIGECYLHGAMYGEAFERLDEDKGHLWETVWLE
ncbi:Heterokaryon incompatibility protein (HET) domain containing protein [Rhypophila decipiens]